MKDFALQQSKLFKLVVQEKIKKDKIQLMEEIQKLISVGTLIVALLMLIVTTVYVVITRDQLLTNKGILETEIRKNIVEAILRIIEYARKIPDNIDENEKNYRVKYFL